MFRGNIEIRKCMKCQKTYKQSKGTIAIKSSSYNKCPYCGEKTQYDTEKNADRIEEIEKKFQKYYSIVERQRER